MKQILQKPYLLLFSMLVFFTPLLMAVNTNELYEFPKMFFVYILGLFTITVFVIDIIINPTEIKKPPFIVSAFIVISIISTILSSHIYTSFFGYYTRFNDGLLSNLIFFGLYIVAINKLDKDYFEKIVKVSLITIIPISIYGLAQYFGGPRILWNADSVSRVFSTIGQPNWLSQYLSILLVVCLYFLFTDKRDFKKWFLLYVLGFYCSWLTYSMSGVLGFVVGLAVLTLILIKKENKNLIPDDILRRLVLVSAISLFIAFSNIGMFGEKLNDAFIDLKKQVSVVKKVYALEEIEYRISDPGFIRLELWKSTFNLIKSSTKVLFFGSGLETFPYSFQAFRNEKLNYSSEWDFVFNKPHNYYLEVWSELGSFALLIYILIIYKALRKSPNYLVPAFTVFSVTNIFGWPSVSTSLLFWIFLAGVKFEGLDFKLNLIRKRELGSSLQKILPVVICLVYLGVVFLLLRIYSADIYFKKSQDLLKENKIGRALFYIDKSIKINPYEPTYYRGRAKINAVYLLDSEDSDLVKDSILQDLQQAYKLNPNNIVIVRNSVPIYYFLAIKDLNVLPGVDNLDEKYVNIVKDFFGNTKLNYWNDVGVISLVAKYEKKLGLDYEYGESVKRVESLRPDLLNWYESFR